MSAPQLHVSPNSLRMTPHVGSDGITLALSNPAADKSVLYKCKTTSPARYVVRNRQGVIAPGGQQTVLITLQRGVVITGEEEMDIFLVEARYLDAGEVESAARTENVSSELMKAKGRAAVGKIQVKCELSLGAAASAAPAAAPAAQPSGLAAQRSTTNDGLVSEAQSTHTQPERVNSTAASTSTVQQRVTPSVDPSPAPRDPAANPVATPLNPRATTSVRPAPVKPKKSSSTKYIVGAVVVIAAAYFAGFIGGGSTEPTTSAAPAAEAPSVPAEPTPAAATKDAPTAAASSKSEKPSSKSSKKKAGGSKSA